MNIELRKLSEKVYLNAKDIKEGRLDKSQMYSVNGVSGEDALRNAIDEACGGKLDYYSLMDNKGKVYRIIADVLALPVARELGNLFGNLAETEDWLLGERKEWKIESLELFDVAKVAAGTNDIRRQKIHNDKKITFETDYVGFKIYAEFEEFRAGRIDFTALVEKVKKSFAKHVTEVTYKAIADSHNKLTADKYAITGTLATEKLLKLIQRLEAKTQMSYGIFGTAGAIGKIGKDELDIMSEDKKKEYGEMGYFAKFRGRDVVEIPQILDANEEFALDDDMLYILPTGIKLVKVVFEGEPIIKDSLADGTNMDSTDEQLEFTFRRKMGVGMIVANYHGVYDMSAQ